MVSPEIMHLARTHPYGTLSLETLGIFLAVFQQVIQARLFIIQHTHALAQLPGGSHFLGLGHTHQRFKAFGFGHGNS